MELLNLPKGCKTALSNLKESDKVIEMFKIMLKKMTYSMESSETPSKIKTPAEVWRDKRGMCFELSYFIIACLKFISERYKLHLKYYYLEMPNVKINGKYWDHAAVLVTYDKKSIILDLGRKKINPRYPKSNRLGKDKLYGNFLVDCALMFRQDRTKLKNQDPQLAKKAVFYAKKALKYYPDSLRAKDIIKYNSRIVINQK
jgi:hypothetical protein